MAFVTYILSSDTLKAFYIGHTDNIRARFRRHQEKGCKSTAKGTPWRIIYQAEFLTRSQAIAQERKIKRKGARSFLQETLEQPDI